MLDSNSFENIVDKKVKLHAYLFSVLSISRKKFRKFSKICFLVFCHKSKNVKIKKIVQSDLYFINIKKINFDIWPD